jgi:amino acid adenylation domain-containing protein
MRRLATAGEKAVWRSVQSGSGAELHLTRVVALGGTLDIAAVIDAAAELGRITPALRLKFVEHEGELFAEPPETGEPIDVVVCDALSEDERRSLVAARFVLDGAAGVRIILDRRGESWELIAVAHHLIVDGATLDAIVTNILLMASGATCAAPRAIHRSPAAGAHDVDTWLASLAMEQDRPRPVRGQANSAVSVQQRPLGSVASALRKAARSGGSSFAHALLSVYAATLHARADAATITFVTPVDIRQRIDRDAWGMGVNSIAVTSTLEIEDSFTVFAARLRKSFLRAYRHRRTPLLDLVDATGLRRRSDGSSILTDYEFNVVDGWRPPTQLSAPASDRPQIVVAPQYDVSVSVIDFGADDVQLCWQVRGSAEAEHEADLLHDIFVKHACAWAASSEARVTSTALMADDVAKKVIALGSGVSRVVDNRPIVDRVWQHCNSRAEAIATVTHAETLTYAQLRERAGAFTAAFSEAGVTVGDRIAVHMERGNDMVAALLGMWSLGAVYLPLDPANPPARLTKMLDSAQPKVVLLDASTARRFTESVPEHRATLLEAESVRLKSPVAAGSIQLKEHLPAYVMFTSGSTGEPKAAEVHIGGFVNHLDEMIRCLRLTHQDTFGQLAPIGFDVHLWQLIAPLVVGGKLRIYGSTELRDPLGLAELMRTEAVTAFQAVPSYLEQWCRLAQRALARGTLPAVRTLSVTGEAFPSELAIRLKRIFPEADLINAYGPAEASDDVTLHVVREGDLQSGGVVPIGTPVANTKLYLLDRWQRLRPPGLVGELAIAGLAVGNGYLGTDERPAFRIDPVALEGRVYLTGDICSMEDGTFRFHGRSDHQVKLGGRRVELQEIESACLSLPGAAAAAACVVRAGSTEALIALVAGDDLSDADAMREELRTQLPAFMVPSLIVPMTNLPLTANGKVDRQSLLETANRALNESSPAVDRQRDVVRATWEEVLGVTNIRGVDNFFALGGDSLSAMRVTTSLQRVGLDVEISQIYDAPTLQTYTELVSAAESSDGPDADGPVLLPAFVQWHLRPDGTGFATAVLFEVNYDASEVSRALRAVARRHPVLAWSLDLTVDGWTGVAASPTQLDGIEAARPDELEATAISAIGLRQLIAWSWISTGDGLGICLAAHHAVVDPQSWMVLLNDLDRALSGVLPVGQERGYPAFCRTESSSAAARNLSWRQPVAVATLDFADAHVADANLTAAVAVAVGRATGKKMLHAAVEHDLRFQAGRHVRGVGCYVGLSLGWLSGSQDAPEAITEAAALLRREPDLETPAMDVDLLINVTRALGPGSSFTHLHHVRTAEATLRYNSLPAAYSVDIEHHPDRVRLILGSAAGDAPTSSDLRDACQAMNAGAPAPSFAPIDLAGVGPTALAQLQAQLGGET